MEALKPSAGEADAAGRFAARITASRPLSANAFELALARPAGFGFSAGQRLRLEYGGAERDYSIASVFVATGTGIAPFRAMTGAGARGFTLLHGVETPADLHYRDFIRPRAGAYVACLSASPPAEPDHFSGWVTDYLRRRLPPGVYDFYLCGRRDMIRDATLLVDERFPDSLVYSETFY